MDEGLAGWPPGVEVSGARGHRVARFGSGASTYWIVDAHKTHPDCGHYSDSAARERTYDRSVTNFARGIGDYRAIVFLEVDSLITVNCLSHHGVQVRLQELHDAFDALSLPTPASLSTPMPARPTRSTAHRAARLLRRAGVSEIQGFFLNATHFDWTRKEIRYGEKISRMTGGKHFVVNTAMNGRGPVIPANRVDDGNENLCSPPGRGLGPLRRSTPASGGSTRSPGSPIPAAPQAVARARRRPAGSGSRGRCRSCATRTSRSADARADAGARQRRGRVIVPQPTTRSPSIRHAS